MDGTEPVGDTAVVKPDTTQVAATEVGEESISVIESTSSVLSSPRRKNLMMAVNTSLQSIDPHSLLKPVQQGIHCTGDDDESSFPIYGNDVTIFPCELDESNRTASSKIRISQVCKYDWEQRYYFGELVASNRTYVAYVVGGTLNKNEHVRVINHKTSSRVLLKGFEGKVTCVVFRGPDDSHLACMDMIGNIRVFLIFEEGKELKFKQIIELLRKDLQKTDFSLVSWAPLMLDDASDEEETSELILAITHKEKAEVLSIRTILEHSEDNCLIEDIKHGRKVIHNGHTQPITQLVIAPNFQVLATSSLDGFVKVWNVGFDEEDDPRCLHEWQPHGAEPITALFFCDNHLAQEENISSWRFLITGAKYNSEIKVWCSVSWTCLQTLRFCANPHSASSDERNPFPRLKPALDKSASFFILSDIKRQVLYVLQLFQDAQEGTCHFTSITEFTLTQPMLSYSLYQSKAEKKSEEELEVADEDEGDEKDILELGRNGIEAASDDVVEDRADKSGGAYQISLKMFGIHDKALQKLHIRYKPSSLVHPPTPSVCTAVSSEDHMSTRDAMSDITESHGGALSDNEDADSFATANLKMPSTKESADSSTSTLTTISVSRSLSAAENDEIIKSEKVMPDKEMKDVEEINEIVYTQQEEKEDINITNDETEGSMTFLSKELPVKDSPQRISPVLHSNDSQVKEVPLKDSQARELPRKESPMKIAPGTVTILKRNEKNGLRIVDNTEDTGKSSNSVDSPELKSKDKKAQKTKTLYSKADSENLMAQLGISPSTKSASVSEENGPQVRVIGKDKDDDIYSFLSLSSASKSSSLVETGDLLGLDFSGSTPYKEQKPAYQDSAQPTGLMLKMLQDQQKSILQLTNVVQDLNLKLTEQMKINEKLNKQQHDEREFTKSALQQMQKSTLSSLSKMSKEISKSCQRIESMPSSIHSALEVSLDNQMQSMFQGINATVVAKLEKSIKSEFRTSFTSNVQKLINGAMDQISNQFSTRLGALEKVFRDEMSAMVKSKHFAESVGFSVTTVLDGILPNAYREAFQNILIPSYEKSCKEMFLQINREFEKGTKSYFQKMDGYFDTKKQKQSDSREPVLKQMQDLSQTFQDTADRLTGIERNLEILMQKQIADAFHKFKSELSATLEQRISKFLLGSFKEAMNSSMSQIKDDMTSIFQRMTSSEQPVGELSMEDRMHQINSYLSECDYSKAFEEALNAVDLTFVLYVCQRVDAEELFSKKGGFLEQPIILSLIQQLSIELTIETELKVNYLSEAIEALDKSHEITAVHMTGVLESLMEQVEGAIVALKSSDEPNKQHQQQLNMLGKLIRAKHN